MFKNYQTTCVVNFLFTDESALRAIARSWNYQKLRTELLEIGITETSESVALNDSSLDCDALDQQIRSYREFSDSPTVKLIIEYREWLLANGLDTASDGDLAIWGKLSVDESTLSDEQRAWLRNFLQRWNAARMIQRIEALDKTIVRYRNWDDPLARLAVEYHEWIIANELAIESACDLILSSRLYLDDSKLSNEEQAWFRDFAHRWEVEHMLKKQRLEDGRERAHARFLSFSKDLGIPDDWIEESWSSPSYSTPNRLLISIDHADEALRNVRGNGRFCAQEHDRRGCIVEIGKVLLVTDSFAEVLEFVRDYEYHK